jgi:hypothetical protein
MCSRRTRKNHKTVLSSSLSSLQLEGSSAHPSPNAPWPRLEPRVLDSRSKVAASRRQANDSPSNGEDEEETGRGFSAREPHAHIQSAASSLSFEPDFMLSFLSGAAPHSRVP